MLLKSLEILVCAKILKYLPCFSSTSFGVCGLSQLASVINLTHLKEEVSGEELPPSYWPVVMSAGHEFIAN